jgi:hypothetical protein
VSVELTAGECFGEEAIPEVRVDGVAFWWNAVLFEAGGEAAGEPNAVEFSSSGPDGHWRECVFFFDTPLYTCVGARVTVTALHDEATVRFEVQVEGQEAAEGAEAGKGSGKVESQWDPVVEDDDSRNDSSRTTTDSEDTDQEEEEVACLGCDRSRLWLLADSSRTDAVFKAVGASLDGERPP